MTPQKFSGYCRPTCAIFGSFCAKSLTPDEREVRTEGRKDHQDSIAVGQRVEAWSASCGWPVNVLRSVYSLSSVQIIRFKSPNSCQKYRNWTAPMYASFKNIGEIKALKSSR